MLINTNLDDSLAEKIDYLLKTTQLTLSDGAEIWSWLIPAKAFDLSEKHAEHIVAAEISLA